MDQPPPIPSSPSGAPPPPMQRMSLLARLLNLFAIPGDVFQDVKGAPASLANWLVPVLLAAAVGSWSMVELASRPEFSTQLREQQAKLYQERVDAGKMTRAEADRELELAKRLTQPLVLKAAGCGVALVVSLAGVFWWALILRFVGTRFFQSIPYGKALEVAGLASLIEALGGLVVFLLTTGLNDGAGSQIMGAKSPDPTPFSPAIIAANLFAIWFVAVLAIGLARLTEVRFVRALFPVMIAWLGFQLFKLVIVGVFGLAF